ncbi:MAG: RluA family pseudouridine synthase [Holosporaceae bacterium]|nr:RluA family pseudouridine synthase [Holosporaceae bacterium]
MEYTVTLDEDNMRADKIVKGICKGISYPLVQKLFRLKKIKVDGKAITSSTRLVAGNELTIPYDIEIHDNSYEKDRFAELKSMIIYDCADFFAINKPAGLAVQMGSKISLCVENFIKSYPDQKCRLVHRLDKDTSGVLLIAKNLSSARRLTKLFRENKIKKTYLAIVDGKVTDDGIVDNCLKKTFIGNEEKVRIDENGRKAITIYKPLRSIGAYTLIELKPLTGRTHQLRVHCAEVLNAPVLGDKKYNTNLHHKKLFLHSYKAYINDYKIEVTAEIPEYFWDIK